MDLAAVKKRWTQRRQQGVQRYLDGLADREVAHRLLGACAEDLARFAVQVRVG